MQAAGCDGNSSKRQQVRHAVCTLTPRAMLGAIMQGVGAGLTALIALPAAGVYKDGATGLVKVRSERFSLTWQPL